MSYDINNANNIDHIIRQSNDLKGNIIKYIKKKKFNIKNIINFIKENINDITTEELSNIKISFTYLNTFN
jgi:vacuolar-type H+-ATPase subunit C/Vma6